ncbi:MAG: AEC family transporter [Clostridia bacterium]|nr:AEC family transporter [Clostridia bacterium]
MNQTLVVMLKNVILFVALAIPGFLMVKSGQLKKEQSGALSGLLMYVGLPFLIFSGTVNNITFDLAFLYTTLVVLTVNLIPYIILTFLLSKPLTAMEKQEKTRSIMRFCLIFPNNGFLGIPLCIAVLGSDSPVLSILILHNIITNVLLYTLGIYLVSGDKKSISLKKAFLNPVILGLLAGLATKLLGLNTLIPEIGSFATHFSGIVTPLSMTILGMKMADVSVGKLFASPKTYYVSFLKLVAVPAMVLGILFGLRAVAGDGVLSGDFLLSVFFAFAMPTAGLSTTFADSFSSDSESAAAFTLGSTLHSVVTIPVLYWLVCLLV